MITDGSLAEISVYPPCTSLPRMCCFCRFLRLMKSISYVLSVRVRIPTPPASTISNNFNLKLDSCVLEARGRSRHVLEVQNRDDQLPCAAEKRFSYN